MEEELWFSCPLELAGERKGNDGGELKIYLGGAEAGKGLGLVVDFSKSLGYKRFSEALPLILKKFEQNCRLDPSGEAGDPIKADHLIEDDSLFHIPMVARGWGEATLGDDGKGREDQ